MRCTSAFCFCVFIPCFVSFLLVTRPRLLQLCSTVYSIRKQIQLLHFTKPVITPVDCTAAHQNIRKMDKYAAKLPLEFLETQHGLPRRGSCCCVF